MSENVLFYGLPYSFEKKAFKKRNFQSGLLHQDFKQTISKSLQLMYKFLLQSAVSFSSVIV